VLSRQQLLDQVWTDATCGDRVVDTHVSNLRKKIEGEPGRAAVISRACAHGVSLRWINYMETLRNLTRRRVLAETSPLRIREGGQL